MDDIEKKIDPIKIVTTKVTISLALINSLMAIITHMRWLKSKSMVNKQTRPSRLK